MCREYRAGPHLRRGRVRPRQRLLAYAQRLGLPRPDAEDLVQELYERLLRPTDDLARDWFSYRLGYLQKLVTNGRRRERRRVYLLEQHAPVAPVDSGLEGRLLVRCAVERTLDRLPPADAKLLGWRYLEDRPIQEIAEHLDMPEFTVRSRLRRALSKAQAIMTTQPAP